MPAYFRPIALSLCGLLLSGCLAGGRAALTGAPASSASNGRDCVAFERIVVDGATKYTLVGGNAKSALDTLPASACPI